MKFTIAAAAILACLLLVSPATATPLVIAGDHYLLPNTPGQVVQILVTNGDPVEGLTLGVVVEDGYPELDGVLDGPNITAVDITSEDTIFGPNNTGQSSGESEQAWSATTSTADDTVNAEGILAFVTIDTTGFASGSFAFVLDNEFVSTDFAGITPLIQNGTLNIVPEPSAIALMTFAGAAMFGWRSRSRSRSRSARSIG